MAALYRVGETFYADFYVNGKRVRVSLGTKHKEKALDRYRTKKDELSGPGENGPAFAAFRKQYVDWAWQAHPASAKEEEKRIAIIEAFLTSHDVAHLADITPWHIDQLKAHLKTRKRPAGPATQNRYLQILRGMFYRASDWGLWTGPNPLRKVKFNREGSVRRLLTDAEVKAIIDAATRLKARSALQREFPDLVRFAANTGMRKSEILNLKWTSVRADEVVVKGKGGKVRAVPLNAGAQSVLDRHPRRSDYVFDIPNRAQQDLFRRTVDKVSTLAKVEFTFHDLRHYFASALVAAGVDMVTIASILGHSHVSTTLIYSHTSAERKRSAVTVVVI